MQIASLERPAPLHSAGSDAGASSPAGTARARLAGDLVDAEREVRTALAFARRELAAAAAIIWRSQDPEEWVEKFASIFLTTLMRVTYSTLPATISGAGGVLLTLATITIVAAWPT